MNTACARYSLLLVACLCFIGLRSPAQTLLKDIRPGSAGSAPSHYINLGGTLYFTADDGVHGQELWKSDGTTVGTVMVKDINPGPQSSDISDLRSCNGLLFFSAFSTIGASFTRQLWRSDGTDAGTFQPYDGHKDGEVQRPINLTTVGNRLFYVTQGSLGGSDQWFVSRSDGTDVKANQPGGTALFFTFDFSPTQDGNHPPTNFTNVNGTLFFTYKGTLYKTVGSPDDPNITVNKVATVPNAGHLINHRGRLYFVAGPTKSEVWTSDGTAAGTTPSVVTGADSVVVLTSAGNYLYFVTGTNQRTLWVGNSKPMPAHKLATFSAGIRDITNLTTSLPSSPLTNSSADVTYLVVGENPYRLISGSWKLFKLPGAYKLIEGFVKIGQSLYFTDALGVYRINDTVAPVSSVTTLFTSSSFITWLTALNNRLYFSHAGPDSGNEPFYVIPPTESIVGKPFPKF